MRTVFRKHYLFGKGGDGEVFDIYFPRRLGDQINLFSFDLFTLMHNYRFGSGHHLEIAIRLNGWDNARCYNILKDFFVIPDSIKISYPPSALIDQDALKDEKEGMDHENIGSNVPVRVMAGNITDGTFVDQVTEDYPIVVRIWDKGNPKRLTDDVYYQVDHPYVKGQRTNLNHAAQTVLVHMYKKHYENHKVISEKNYDKLIKHLESLGWKVIIAETLHHTQLTEIHQQNILDTTIHPSPGLEFDAYDPFVMTQSNRPPSYWNKLIKDQLESCTFVLASEGGISHLARLMGVPQLVWYQKGNAPSYIEHMNWNGDTYQQIDGRSVDNIDTFQAKMDHVLDHAYG